MRAKSNTTKSAASAAKKLNIQSLARIGLMTAVISVMAQIALPLPSGVPLTFQTFAITVAAIVLSPKESVIATLIYLLLGAIGVPVFANLKGGFHCVFGPTGGFLLSFPLMVLCIGLGVKYRRSSKGLYTLTLIAGNALNLLMGTVQYVFWAKVSFSAAFAACVVPFIPATIIKMILGTVVGFAIKKRLRF